MNSVVYMVWHTTVAGHMPIDNITAKSHRVADRLLIFYAYCNWLCLHKYENKAY